LRNSCAFWRVSSEKGEQLLILIAFGANLPSQAGPPPDTFLAAIAHLARSGVRVTAKSRNYRSPPWPAGNGPDFFNFVAQAETRLRPGELLQVLLKTEAFFGRVRREKWGPRPLDLDLLDYHGLVTDAAHLSLPHPAIGSRAFVLLPLQEVAPGWRHPETSESAEQLLLGLPKADIACCKPANA
jgi:2-amino-4-hydroxy-6-hydroxymethyldihydropteridine diphosphokinase